MSSFKEAFDEMRMHNMAIPIDKVSISVPEAKRVLMNAMSYFLSLEGKSLQWLSEYEEIAEWLSDNQGRGLFMFGNCGRGKSLLGRFVIPAILLKYCRKVVKVYNVQEMNTVPDEVLSKHILSIDDIGTEEVSNSFGNKRMIFGEVMDLAEKEGKLIIISSNLNLQDLQGKYGDRIADRIKSTTTRVLFKGGSLRS